MAGCWKYDVFPSFSGEDVRKSFLSHFLEKLQSKSIITFIDNGIERSRPIAPELLLAIRVSKISIVVFSKKYASSTWCLNELAEIHKCYKELNQMVIPIFYDVDPSDVRKQTGEFGKAFDETCKGKSEDLYRSWVRALVAVANMAGEDLQNWRDEADMIEKISKDVLNKLITPSDDFRDYVGIQEHIEAIMDSKLCLESGGVRMVGIVGPSGIGKTTIARALFHRLSNQFDHRAFVSYKRTNMDDYGMKLCWAKQFLSDILCQNDIKIESLGVVEQRLKHKKVLIVLDDVDEIELLETLVGQSGWFGFGSRIIVVTRDRALLNAHEIDLIYEVEYPSKELALKMFCRSAFRRNSPPDDFKWYADLVVHLCGYLPLGLNVLGSSLRGKDIEYWEEMMPRLRDSLDGKIEKTLRISYDELDGKDQELFLYIACLFNGEKAKYIKDLLKGSVSIGLRILADKSLIRLTSPHKTVQMHTLLEKLGREIVRAESIYNPGKRRFLVDANDISDVLQDDTGTEKNVLGIRLNVSEIKEPLYIDENSFRGMHSLQIIKIYSWSGNGTGEVKFDLPQGQVIYLPRKLRLLHWVEYPAKYIPSSFSAEYLVELRMVDSKLEKLWQGTQSLRNLKTMELSGSRYLKEIPNLSKATNLEEMFLDVCTSLAMLPSSIQHLDKLETLEMRECTSLEVLPNNINLLSLSWLNLSGCSRLTSFPQLSTSIDYLYLDRTAIEEVPSWIEKIAGLELLSMTGCKKLRKISATIWNLKHLVRSFDYHTVVSDASLVQTVAELHPESIKYYTKVLGGSRSTSEFLLARGAQEFILQTDFKYAILPGKEVPMYFTHRSHGRSLTVPLPRSSLSQNHLEFAGCIILDLDLDLVTDFKDFYHEILDHKMIVHWRFRVVTGICRIKPATDPCKMDNLVVFHFGFDNGEEVDDSSSQSDYNNVEFEFEAHYGNGNYCDCYSLLSIGDYDLETRPICQRIKGCGVRVLRVSPSLDANATISETEYNQQDGGRDAESERSSESEDNHQSSESDAESKRSKKRMRMTVITSQEPSNLPRQPSCSGHGNTGS